MYACKDSIVVVNDFFFIYPFPSLAAARDVAACGFTSSARTAAPAMCSARAEVNEM